MLYIKNRQDCKKSVYPIILICLILFISGCGDNSGNHSHDKMTMDAFSGLRTQEYVLNSQKIKSNIDRICRIETDTVFADKHTHDYYTNHGSPLWVTRYGVKRAADSLLTVLKTVEDSLGFTCRSFDVELIENDMQRIRNLDFDNDGNSVNDVMARLEFRLTKAYLRYAVGQRFGFVNPHYIFNKLDAIKNDSTQRVLGYRRLFDIDIQRPDSNFFKHALNQISNDSISEFLHGIQPKNKLYTRLKNDLSTAQSNQDNTSRMRILCNMERCRWRMSDRLDTSGKYIIVNIPAYHLYAYSNESVLDMRIGCGSMKTKTPLLSSAIKWMEVNPVWNIPMSIIKNEVAPHAGDTSYFKRNNYYIVERKTGDRIDINDMTPRRLRSGNYAVIQEGGDGNSLGRIIFRFPNNFSVFLHDTSSRGVFNRDNRGVSHGCVRVQKPFELASFLLDNPDEWLLDKLRISMDIKPETDKGKRYVRNEDNNTRLIRSLTVNPNVPLLITYYTIYETPDGLLSTYPDVYGYDNMISRHIKPFMK